MTLSYGRMLFFVQSVVRSMRLTRQRNLALLALGIARVRDGHLTVSEIARVIPTRSDHWYKFKRMKRFLANPRWSPAAHFGALAAFVVGRFRLRRYLPVIIDQSTIGGRWEVLWASVPFRGRALPIAFRLFRYADIAATPRGSQNTLEETFVRQVVSQLPDGVEPLLLFDRGYARVSLFRLLDQLGVRYVVRVKKDVWVAHGSQYQGLLGNIQVPQGALLWWPGVTYHHTHRYRVNLAIARDARAEEPWYLVTNLSRAISAVHWYERRFRCEELFRDLKDQLHLETIRLQHPDRVERLLFGMVILYHALTLLGAEAQRRRLRKKVCKDRVSLAWLGLRLLAMPLLLRDALIHAALHLSSWSLLYESG